MAHDPIVLGKAPDISSRIDGVHVAVFPIQVSDTINPGTHVGVSKLGKLTTSTDKIGIVDPFLFRIIPGGTYVYIWLYPMSIRNLHHTWDKVETDDVPVVHLGHECSKQARRDAVHVAIQPVLAGEELCPCQRITVDKGIATVAEYTGEGIVDPFLTDAVEKGNWLWMCMIPGQFRNFRHTWTHKVLDGEE